MVMNSMCVWLTKMSVIHNFGQPFQIIIPDLV
jgi:hypothetical protein